MDQALEAHKRSFAHDTSDGDRLWRETNPARVNAEVAAMAAAVESVESVVASPDYYEAHRTALKELVASFADVAEPLREAWSMPPGGEGSGSDAEANPQGYAPMMHKKQSFRVEARQEQLDGGGWTASEDHRLRVAVGTNGVQNWQLVAAHHEKLGSDTDSGGDAITSDTNGGLSVFSTYSSFSSFNSDNGSNNPLRKRSAIMCEWRWRHVVEPELRSRAAAETGTFVDDAADVSSMNEKSL